MHLNAREQAIDILVIFEQKNSYSNLILQEQLRGSKLDVRDRGFVTELVYGTIQRLNTIDFVVNSFLQKKDISKLDSWVRQLLRITVYQLRYLDKIPEHAAVYEAVEIAKKRGHRGIASFVNGVIRNIIRNPDKPEITNGSNNKGMLHRLSLEHSIPVWLAKKWIDQFGITVVNSFLPEINKAPKFTIRRNILKYNDDKNFEQLLTEANITWDKSQFINTAYYLKNIGDITTNQLFLNGSFSIQDESSMLVGKVMAPFVNASVLDACAAPGGKTTHIAELQNDQGYIVANELHKHKLSLIQSLADRLGIKSINLHAGDFLDYNSDILFDYVLLDAPCSGLGVIRRKPELKWRMNENLIDSLIEIQNKLIRQAAKFVKPGGSLIYSTCTINKDENINLIEGFLAEHKEFYGNDISNYLPKPLKKFMENNYSIQLLPNYMESDGFFIAKITRK